MESILTTTKTLAQLGAEYDAFDSQIIMYINSVFLTLKQLGVGPEEGFSISDKYASWEDFIPDNAVLRESVKAYMGDKVRLRFDPPTSTALLDALNRAVAECEFRLNLEAES